MTHKVCCIFFDADGKPRAWGVADDTARAFGEARRQLTAYCNARPDGSRLQPKDYTPRFYDADGREIGSGGEPKEDSLDRS